jgi:cytoskeletal protein CcmA (bactofilin family)
MKKLLFLCLAVLIYPLTTSPAFAFEKTTFADKHLVIEADQVVDNDLFLAGETVEIYGTINGDVYVAGGEVLIDGTINGDLLVAGGQVIISGTITQDARLLGGQINFSGTVNRNLTLAGGSINLLPTAVLGNNLVIAGGNATIQTEVPGNLTLGVGTVLLSSRVGGDVQAGVGNLHLTNEALIEGNLRYLSDRDLRLSGNATVSGQIERVPPESLKPQDLDRSRQEFIQGARMATNAFHYISLISSAILGLLIIRFLPNFSYRAITLIEERPAATFVTGLITLLVSPAIILLLFLLIITIPLSFLSIAIFTLAVYTARLFFIYWLGARLLNRLKRQAGRHTTFLIGAGIYYLLTAIAIIGPLTLLVATIFGLGALVLAKKRTYESARKLKLV